MAATLQPSLNLDNPFVWIYGNDSSVRSCLRTSPHPRLRAGPKVYNIHHMSRRVVFLIALIALAVLGTAASPWTLPGGGLSAELTQHVKDSYGLDLTVRGRSTFAVLPIPRVKFENVTLRFPDEALKAEGGTLRGELRLLPLLFGRIELSDFDLSETRITGSLQKLQAVDWAKVCQERRQRDPCPAPRDQQVLLTMDGPEGRQSRPAQRRHPLGRRVRAPDRGRLRRLAGRAGCPRTGLCLPGPARLRPDQPLLP